ncbi:hypothetical protein EKO27_g6321 [Xylaria grammica]|uniref:Uncharacterized protein n=1 Tax=Xylaria grammica TaxID=363999 RepID=A0A439D3D3_9PEZI|nr:hypothetical protein EKO27_g6321 [Xylaria grammica]
MAQPIHRNPQAQAARKMAFIIEKIQVIGPAKKEELLIQAAIRDSVTGGDICQTAIPARGDRPRIVNRYTGQSLDDLKREVAREALSHLGRYDRDQLLLRAGLRNNSTAGDILRAAMNVQARGNNAGNGEGSAGGNQN